MKILIACECSGRVRDAFTRLGHTAYSCDIQPDEDGEFIYHLQMDWHKAITIAEWDMVIAFPPCTNLCSSGARHFEVKRADGRQRQAVEFFMEFTKLKCPWAIENPVGIMSSLYRKPDQIIQPWQFGHGETKATCLWLNGLPKLAPTKIVAGRESRVHRMPQSPRRAIERSRTYQGIADAMAAQWGITKVSPLNTTITELSPSYHLVIGSEC